MHILDLLGPLNDAAVVFVMKFSISFRYAAWPYCGETAVSSRHSVGGGRRQPQLPPPRLHVCWSSLLLIHQGNTKDPLAVVHRNYRTAPTFSASLALTLAISALLWSSSYIWYIGTMIFLKSQDTTWTIGPKICFTFQMWFWILFSIFWHLVVNFGYNWWF